MCVTVMPCGEDSTPQTPLPSLSILHILTPSSEMFPDPWEEGLIQMYHLRLSAVHTHVFITL